MLLADEIFGVQGERRLEDWTWDDWCDVYVSPGARHQIKGSGWQLYEEFFTFLEPCTLYRVLDAMEGASARTGDSIDDILLSIKGVGGVSKWRFKQALIRWRDGASNPTQ